VTAPPGDTARLFVVEQGGRIRIVKDRQVLLQPFLDLRDRVILGGERGLLSLAFHPDYARNGRFFVDYTMVGSDGVGLVSIISRFRVSEDDPDRADPESEEIVLEQPQPYVAHNGGQLFFDSAGYLYISFGDGGESAVRQHHAQDPTTWLGKILRIDPDGDDPYAIPPDNPFAGPDGVLDEIWASGFRNPWRASVDPASGIVYVGDVGEGRAEEINVIPPDLGGSNYGWCCREGDAPFSGRCFESTSVCPPDGEGLTAPIHEYGHDQGCAVTGGFVYRGCALPDLRGTYFYGDYCTGFIRSFVYRSGRAEDARDWSESLAPGDGRTIDRIAGFGQDALGEIYICDFNGGEVFKIVPDD
jgi:glucose/arabinose dehydrogenase